MGGLLVLCALLTLALMGCGQKGPPLPPEVMGQKISEPYDLKLTYKENTVFLTWSHRVDSTDAQIKPESFDVFMAQKTFDACEDCPFQFKLASSVPVRKKQLIIQVKKGYKYYFRIQAIGKDNLKSSYSKTIQFEYN